MSRRINSSWQRVQSSSRIWRKCGAHACCFFALALRDDLTGSMPPGDNRADGYGRADACCVAFGSADGEDVAQTGSVRQDGRSASLTALVAGLKQIC